MTSDETAGEDAMTDSDDLKLDELFDGKTEMPEATADDKPGQPRDENGRFAPKAETEPEAQAATDPAEEPDTAEPEPPARHVPLKELQTERQKRQEEARLRLEAEARAKVLEEQFAKLQQTQRQPQPQPVQQPDWYTEPERAAMTMEQRLLIERTRDKVNMSREIVSSMNQDYAQAERAFYELANANPHLWDRLYAHPLPAKFAYEEGKKAMALKEIGDPAQYRQKLEAELREKVLAELKAGTLHPNGQTPPKARFPATLADNTATGSQAAMMTDEAMMAGVFARR